MATPASTQRGEEPRQRRCDGDTTTAGTRQHRPGRHHRAGAEAVEPPSDRDPDQRGHHQAGGERGGHRGDRPAGVGGDARGEHREGVVQHAPADDLGDAQDHQHPAEPGRRSASRTRPRHLRTVPHAASPSAVRGPRPAPHRRRRRPHRSAGPQHPAARRYRLGRRRPARRRCTPRSPAGPARPARRPPGPRRSRRRPSGSARSR